MAEKLKDTIKRISKKHLLENNGLLLGQCLTAVGWVGGTVPELKEKDGIIELSMADVAGGGIAVGAALAGRRPIYVVRFQGFQWYNAVEIVNYAAKSKEMWGRPCPLFVRSIAMDAGGGERSIGPVASGSHHGIYTRMPGIPVCAPMTSKEYKSVWKYFMNHDDPIYVSEHRRGWDLDFEMEDKIYKKAEITLFPISSTRLNAIEASEKLEKEGIKCNIIHLLWLKPFKLNKKDNEIKYSLLNSKFGGIIIDGDYENSISKCIAYDLMHKYNKNVHALGLEERTAGFAPHLDNLPPSAKRIESKVKEIIFK